MSVETVTYSVPGIHCDNCQQKIHDKVSAVPGVKHATVNRETHQVTVQGTNMSDQALRAAIEEAGYNAD